MNKFHTIVYFSIKQYFIANAINNTFTTKQNIIMQNTWEIRC